jgi:hypothetical protein
MIPDTSSLVATAALAFASVLGRRSMRPAGATGVGEPSGSASQGSVDRLFTGNLGMLLGTSLAGIISAVFPRWGSRCSCGALV